MKYKIPLLSLLSLSAMADGKWYVGGGLGTTIVNTQAQNNINSRWYMGSDGHSRSEQRLNKAFLAGQIQAGYSKNFHNFFSIGEVFGIISPGKASGTEVDPWSPINANTFTASLSRPLALGLSGKIGVPIIDTKWSVYGTVSLLRSRFKFTETQIYNGSSFGTNKKKTVWGMAPGIGTIYKSSEKTSLRLEYNYELYQTIKTARYYTYDATNNYPTNAEVNPRYHTVMLSLSYEF
jgi:opacity protein-like surface antigen